MFAFVGGAAHEYGVRLGAQSVRKHLGEGGGYGKRKAVVVDEVVGGLRPLECDIWSVLLVEGDESAVEFAAFVVEDAHGDLYAGVAQLLDSASVHLGKGVDTSHHASLYTFLYYKVGARRSLAVVRARLKADVYCGVAEQRFVLGAYRCECVHLGMWPAIAAVVALAYDASVGRYDDSSYHRIGLCAHYAAAGKLQTAVHVLFVGHCFFSSRKEVVVV